ncbi:hypothetical protein Q8F55_001930 [Vanrija albida]|uniref:Zn(2)-C6 fungal-type domain-containing protein n=1 Tax=Vanrija albida TaxID=181172 RepID=A0ABR3Q908_9TREE
MPYNYSVPGQVDYLAGDYTNINGVIPQLQAEHYVAGTADDYNQVTLSNWAEANPADPNGGVPSLVTDDANGGQVVIPEHHAAQALSVTGNGDGEKPKKLVLACHFCRGRKLKCDGGRPTCTHCAKRQLVCTYDEQVRRRGPGKRTKEMRERAAREAEAAGLGLNPESLAHLTGEPGPSSLMEAPKKAGRKRKSEAVDEAEKKARMEQEHAEAQAAVQAAAQAHAAAQLSAHVGLEHSLGEHDQPLIDPALAGEGGAVLDLPPLEPGTLGQVIQQLNGAQQ